MTSPTPDAPGAYPAEPRTRPGTWVTPLPMIGGEAWEWTDQQRWSYRAEFRHGDGYVSLSFRTPLSTEDTPWQFAYTRELGDDGPAQAMRAIVATTLQGEPDAAVRQVRQAVFLDHVQIEEWAAAIVTETTGREPDRALFGGDARGLYVGAGRALVRYGETVEAVIRPGADVEFRPALLVETDPHDGPGGGS